MLRVVFLALLFIYIANAKEATLKINACGITRGAFVKKLTSEFSKRFNIKVILNKKGGVQQAINAVRENRADIGFGCRKLLDIPSEKEIKEEQVGWGALAFLVNRKNRVDSITLQQVKDILLGKITNWKELGGEDAPINLYLRKSGVKSGVGYSLRKIIFKNLQIKLKDTKYLLPNSDYIRVAVYKDPYAFAVGDFASAAAFGKVKLLKVNGVAPSKKALISKQYKALRPYFIYMPQNLTPEAKIFINFVLSKEGQEVLKSSFATSLDEGARILNIYNESAKLENFKTDNQISMSEIVNRFRGKKLVVYACGITRVAFAKNIIDSFSKKYGVKVIANVKGGVPYVLKKLHKKEAQIGFVCRKPFKTADESDLWSIQVAWGALAFIVNSQNSVSNLTTKEIKDIVNGKIKNWKSVGGKDAPIHLILREGYSSGVGSTLRSILFKDKQYKLNSAFKYVKNSSEARKAVLDDPLAIAVDDVTSSQKIKGIKILSIDNVSPTKRAIIEGDYKFRRPFYAVMRQAPQDLSKIFINYTLSQIGQKIISLSGTANLAEGKDLDSQNNYIIQQLKLRLHKTTPAKYHRTK